MSHQTVVTKTKKGQISRPTETRFWQKYSVCATGVRGNYSPSQVIQSSNKI